MIRTLFRQTEIPAPIHAVFDFFSKAENLNRITPPDLQFKILSPLTPVMQKGLLINYQINLQGIPLKWKTEITHWLPPYSFQDTQLKGPYLLWKHLHIFSDKGDCTLMADKVYYRIPGFVFEPLIYHAFVRKKLNLIFDYREKAIQEIFSQKNAVALNS
ncbi:MAG: SRPBCC family protein [Bacteroidia bacterium]|nr:SRPBCC family protein [Bacteroidia bacterium]